MGKNRVAIVEDKRDIREGLEIVINNSSDNVCVGTFRDAESAIESMGQLNPDVVLMDIGLPKMNGIDCVRILKEKLPDIDIIMLTVHADDEFVFQSLSAGACGYLMKNTFPSKLLNAIKEAKNGGAPMTSNIARLVVNSFNGFSNPQPTLTKREKEVLNLLCEGKSYNMIAENLFVTRDTVRYHLKNIYQKLQVNSKSEAVSKALKNRII
ncbi:MAG: response regulator transcription factor [Bacteroidota bacterium]